MASIRKIKSGWQAQVARLGVRASKTFPTKREAQDWAARQEHLILTGQGQYGPGTLGDLFDRYAREVSPTKRGERWEILRLAKLARDPLAKIEARNARPGDFADWRDRRLREVAPGTVRREMILLSAVMSQAAREWGTFPVSPMIGVKRPSAPPHRERRVSDAEIAALVAAGGDDMTKPMARAVHAFRFAIETGMRAGEICGLTSADVTGRVARLPKTKNGTARNVPLSSEALRLWAMVPDGFGLEPAALDANFRRAKALAKIEGLTFHDSRHEAITRLAAKVDVLDLARIVGHRDLSMLRIYYNATAEEIADRLK